MTDTEIILIGRKVTGEDKFGQPIYENTRTGVLAISVPVTRSEYYSAAQIGIEDEREFIINPAEYDGQILVEIYGGKKLKVVRTFKRSEDELEVYCSGAPGYNEGGGS